MMIIQSAWQLSFDFFPKKAVVVVPETAQLTSDAGLLPIRQFDERIGLTAQFAAALHDPRDQDSTEHTFAEMVRMRIYGILADYADQNDHDVLRYDPVFKIIAGRSPEGRELASQPTLSRFENAIDIPSLPSRSRSLTTADELRHSPTRHHLHGVRHRGGKGGVCPDLDSKRSRSRKSRNYPFRSPTRPS